MALINTEWRDAEQVRALESEKDIVVLTPYPTTITLIRRYGSVLVTASHDGTDEAGDAEMLKMLCLYRFNNKGGQDV